MQTEQINDKRAVVSLMVKIKEVHYATPFLGQSVTIVITIIIVLQDLLLSGGLYSK